MPWRETIPGSLIESILGVLSTISEGIMAGAAGITATDTIIIFVVIIYLFILGAPRPTSAETSTPSHHALADAAPLQRIGVIGPSDFSISTPPENVPLTRGYNSRR